MHYSGCTYTGQRGLVNTVPCFHLLILLGGGGLALNTKKLKGTLILSFQVAKKKH